MAVIVTTSKPAELLAAIKKQIADKKIETWAAEKDFITHSPPQWNRKAWFRATASAGSLTFNLMAPQGGSITTEVYAVYHGRFIEMLAAHFNQSFSQAAATAVPTAGDKMKSSA